MTCLTEQRDWHNDFPEDVQPAMWHIIAKALMLREGGFITVSQSEQRLAARTHTLISMDADGSLDFFVEGAKPDA